MIWLLEKAMLSLRQRDRAFPILYWVAAFVALNLILPQPGNENPASRLATMAAMTESHTLHIDDYVKGPLRWTNDWCRAPDGHYYSNKAPGPMLIGYPFFWLLDRLVVQPRGSPVDQILTRQNALPLYNGVLSILLQVLPMAVLVY